MIYPTLVFPLRQRLFWRRVAQRRKAWAERQDQDPVTASVGDGVILKLRKDDALSELLFCRSFEWAEREWLKGVLTTGRVFYDVGAHVGYFALLAARRNCSVVAFEATPITFRRLTENVAVNSGIGEFRAFRIALSDAQGTVPFFVSTAGRDAWNSLAPPREEGPIERIEVETARLDDFVREHGLPLPDVMKIDVEGWEPRVLAGAERVLREKAPVLLVEFTRSNLLNAGSSPEALSARLEELGYRLHVYDPRRRRLVATADLGCEHRNIVAIPRSS